MQSVNTINPYRCGVYCSHQMRITFHSWNTQHDFLYCVVVPGAIPWQCLQLVGSNEPSMQTPYLRGPDVQIILQSRKATVCKHTQWPACLELQRRNSPVSKSANRTTMMRSLCNLRCRVCIRRWRLLGCWPGEGWGLNTWVSRKLENQPGPGPARGTKGPNRRRVEKFKQFHSSRKFIFLHINPFFNPLHQNTKAIIQLEHFS